MTRARYSREQRENALRLYKEGRHSLAEIAFQTGASYEAVGQWASRAGLTGKRRGMADSPCTLKVAATAQQRVPSLIPDKRNLTGRTFGDPLPGRSALDQRGCK